VSYWIAIASSLLSIVDIFAIRPVICEGWVRAVVFNNAFNNFSVISWQSVLLVEENGVPRKNHLTNFIT
jgi:hypothetical protein